jgi:hypothetical protein
MDDAAQFIRAVFRLRFFGRNRELDGRVSTAIDSLAIVDDGRVYFLRASCDVLRAYRGTGRWAPDIMLGAWTEWSQLLPTLQISS